MWYLPVSKLHSLYFIFQLCSRSPILLHQSASRRPFLSARGLHSSSFLGHLPSFVLATYPAHYHGNLVIFSLTCRTPALRLKSSLLNESLRVIPSFDLPFYCVLPVVWLPFFVIVIVSVINGDTHV